MSTAIDLCMFVIDQGETYRAPQAARPVDDVCVPFNAVVQCAFCDKPASPRHIRALVRTCGAPECQAQRHERRQRRRRAETDAVSVRGTYRHRP